MRGSIVRKRDKYWVVTDVPTDDGRRRQKWHAGYPTRREAERELIQVLARIQTGGWVEPSQKTLESYLLEDWLPAVTTTLRPATVELYRKVLVSYVVPALGKRRLADLDPLMITKHYAVLLRTPLQRRTGTLSARTVRYTHVVLRKAMSDAVLWRLLDRNPCDAAKPPSAGAARPPEMKTWSLEQLQTFLRATADDREHVGWLLAAACGLRRGEVCGLRWQDLELSPTSGPPVLRVRQQVVLEDKQSVVRIPKTKASLRTVALDPGTVEVLRRHRIKQGAERLAAGPAYDDHDLVICRPDGRPVNPTDWSVLFFKAARRLGLPHIRFHDLRHTHATLALQVGIHPKIMSERLGHTSTSFTLDIYSHAVPTLQADAALAVGALIHGT